MPDSDDGAAANHPYTANMDSDTAALFDRMPSDADLGYEVKLLRTCLAVLSDDLRRNARLIMQIIQAVVRAVQVHLKQGSGMTRLEQLLHETAEQVRKEREKRDE